MQLSIYSRETCTYQDEKSATYDDTYVLYIEAKGIISQTATSCNLRAQKVNVNKQA